MARSWISERLAALETLFKAEEDPKRATDMARYMKDQFAFFGFPATERRALQRQAFAGAPGPTETDVKRLTKACWRKKQREFQYFGADYVRQHIEVCDQTFLSQLEFLITHKSWWDTVDVLAGHGVGGLARRFRPVADEMDNWIDSDNMWIARAALLYQLGFKADTDADQLFGFCERRIKDTEFFIRKAIGWALREYSKTDPRAVRSFARKHDTELSGLSKREALKWLNRN
jgi:3-methyladenine DNA glycosylase AlkD